MPSSRSRAAAAPSAVAAALPSSTNTVLLPSQLPPVVGVQIRGKVNVRQGSTRSCDHGLLSSFYIGIGFHAYSTLKSRVSKPANGLKLAVHQQIVITHAACESQYGLLSRYEATQRTSHHLMTTQGYPCFREQFRLIHLLRNVQDTKLKKVSRHVRPASSPDALGDVHIVCA